MSPESKPTATALEVRPPSQISAGIEHSAFLTASAAYARGSTYEPSEETIWCRPASKPEIERSTTDSAYRHFGRYAGQQAQSQLLSAGSYVAVPAM